LLLLLRITFAAAALRTDLAPIAKSASLLTALKTASRRDCRGGLRPSFISVTKDFSAKTADEKNLLNNMGKNKNNNKGSGAAAANPEIKNEDKKNQIATSPNPDVKKSAETSASPTVSSSSEKKTNPNSSASKASVSSSEKKAKASSIPSKKAAITPENENDGDDEEDGEDEEEEEEEDEDDNVPMVVLKHDVHIRQRASAAAREESSQLRDFKPTDDDSDDTLIIASAIFGFLLCMLCGALLPQFGVDPQHVMLGGMLTMLGLVVYNMLCPNCGGRKSPSYNDPDSQISPFLVFLFCGCIGAMLGGMFGGVFANLDFKKFPKDHWVRFISGK
jgi:hypothetical protein